MRHWRGFAVLRICKTRECSLKPEDDSHVTSLYYICDISRISAAFSSTRTSFHTSEDIDGKFGIYVVEPFFAEEISSLNLYA